MIIVCTNLIHSFYRNIFPFSNAEDKVEDTKDLTPEEILQRARNAKRRRIKYKSVHTGRNKSYTEVLREVIGNQMELYHEYVTNTTQPIDNSSSNNEIIHNGDQQQELPVSYMQESIEKHDKTASDKVSSVDSSYGHYSEKDDFSDRGGNKESSYHKEHSRRWNDDRDRYRSKRRSRERHKDKRYSRSHHRNGYDRTYQSHRRSDRDRR